MNKGILCVIDFSDSSKDVLRWAVTLTQELGCTLSILYTYRFLKPYDHNEEAGEMKRKIETEAAKKFSQLESELLVGKGITYNFKIEVGFIADRAKNHIKKNGADLLVLGKKMDSINKQSFDELMADLQMPLVIIP
jgi:nucleotide-binding universal stress UspA family protein